MEKKDFLDFLNVMRTGQGNFRVANEIHYDIAKYHELADIIINDLGLSACQYLSGRDSDSVMAAEYSLYCFRKVLEFHPEKAPAIFKILEKMAKVKIVYDGIAAGICVKIINEIGRNYSTSPALLTEYTDIVSLLRRSNSWATQYID